MYEGKTWRQWSDELDQKLAALKMDTLDDEMTEIYLKLEYNEKIRKAWENERIAKNSQKSLWEMVGTKVNVNCHGKYCRRVLKWNGYHFYTLIDNQKAVVKYSTIWDNWEVEYWTTK